MAIGLSLVIAAIAKLTDLQAFEASLDRTIGAPTVTKTAVTATIALELTLGAAAILGYCLPLTLRLIAVMSLVFLLYTLFVGIAQQTFSLVGPLECHCLGEFTPTSMLGKLAINVGLILATAFAMKREQDT